MAFSALRSWGCRVENRRISRGRLQKGRGLAGKGWGAECRDDGAGARVLGGNKDNTEEGGYAVLASGTGK